jgi:hypothetical protein
MKITADFVKTQLLKNLPQAAYSFGFEESSNGPLIRIVPTNPRAAQLSVWVDDVSSFCDFSFGRSSFGELDIDRGDELLLLAEAVIRGDIVEKIWRIGSHELYAKSMIQTSEGKRVLMSGMWIFYPPWLKHTYRYEPFWDAPH